jgi:hypothetical protein
VFGGHEEVGVRRRIAATISALLAWSAATVCADSQGTAQPPEIEFFVYYHSSKGPILGRSGVDVSRISSSGTSRLGSTGSEGIVRLRAEDVFAPGSIALLFCDQKLPQICSAIRVDSQFLQGFGEFNVHLPSLELIDRMRVTPR